MFTDDHIDFRHLLEPIFQMSPSIDSSPLSLARKQIIGGFANGKQSKDDIVAMSGAKEDQDTLIQTLINDGFLLKSGSKYDIVEYNKAFIRDRLIAARALEVDSLVGLASSSNRELYIRLSDYCSEIEKLAKQKKPRFAYISSIQSKFFAEIVLCSESASVVKSYAAIMRPALLMAMSSQRKLFDAQQIMQELNLLTELVVNSRIREARNLLMSIRTNQIDKLTVRKPVQEQSPVSQPIEEQSEAVAA